MPAADPYGFSGAPDGPYVDAFAITASDTVDFTKVTSAIWIGTAQTAFTVVMKSGAVVNFGIVAAGTLLRVRATRLNSTGSTPGTGAIGLI